MYLADVGKGAAVAGAAEDGACEGVASVDEPLEQAVRVPSASIALTPMSRVRNCFLMSPAWIALRRGAWRKHGDCMEI
jgi:ribonuclease I